MYLENVSKALQSAFKFTPDLASPEVLHQIRSSVLQALAESWEQFMRSPQFLEGMRQWTDNAIAFRSMTNEFLGRVRNEAQAPSRSDIDTVMLAVRHMEKRLLDRLDEVSAQLTASNGSQRGATAGKARRVSKRAKPRGSDQRRSVAQK